MFFLQCSFRPFNAILVFLFFIILVPHKLFCQETTEVGIWNEELFDDDGHQRSFMMISFIETIRSYYQGKNVFEDLFDDTDKSQRLRKIASVSDEQQAEIAQKLETNIRSQTATREFNEFSRRYHKHIQYHNIRLAYIPQENIKEYEKLHISTMQISRDEGTKIFKATLKPSQLRILRESFLVDPPAVEISVFQDENTFSTIKIPIINFDAYEALDLSEPQKMEILEIWEKEADMLIKTFQCLYLLNGSDASKVNELYETINIINKISLQMKNDIDKVLNKEQINRIEQLKLEFAQLSPCAVVQPISSDTKPSDSDTSFGEKPQDPPPDSSEQNE